MHGARQGECRVAAHVEEAGIARHRIADSFADGKTETAVLQIVVQHTQHHQATSPRLAFPPDSSEVATQPDAILALHPQ